MENGSPVFPVGASRQIEKASSAAIFIFHPVTIPVAEAGPEIAPKSPAKRWSEFLLLV
jgi:hypothetical protein